MTAFEIGMRPLIIPANRYYPYDIAPGITGQSIIIYRCLPTYSNNTLRSITYNDSIFS